MIAKLNKKPIILHLTVHLGGGVGRVILNYIEKDNNFTHKIVCLDYANDNSIKTAKKLNLELYSNMSKHHSTVLELIKKADITLIHFWNHPLLYEFIVKHSLPPSKVICWSHISGCCPPHNFTQKILNYPDLFVFNTPLAFNALDVETLQPEQKTHLKTIWATGGIDHVKDIKPLIKEEFNIGYIGTVDYCRLHKDFLTICDKINIKNVKFTVCGGNKEEEIFNQAKQMGINEKFNFTGKVKDVGIYLKTFDVFAYPLVSNHSGTCDLVLQEAMAAGIVPIVLANPMESYIVKNGITGIVANTTDEFISAIERLYQDKNLKNKLSKQAKEYSLKAFSLETLVNSWAETFNEVLEYPKTVKKWPINKSENTITPIDFFYEALGNYATSFKSYFMESTKEISLEHIKALAKLQIWQGCSKGTVHQYYKFFNEDLGLQELSSIMLEAE